MTNSWANIAGGVVYRLQVVVGSTGYRWWGYTS